MAAAAGDSTCGAGAGLLARHLEVFGGADGAVVLSVLSLAAPRQRQQPVVSLPFDREVDRALTGVLCPVRTAVGGDRPAAVNRFGPDCAGGLCRRGPSVF